MQQQAVTKADEIPQSFTQILLHQRLYTKRAVLSNKQNAQGKVFLVEHNKIPYAAKLFLKVDAYEEEFSILERVKEFPYVIQLVEGKVDAQFVGGENIPARPVIVMGLAEHGDLCDFFIRSSQYGKSTKTRYMVPIPIAKTLFAQILTACKKLHEKGFVHRDIKLQNIIFDSDFNAILADFGLCYQLGVEGQSIYAGTPDWIAPEVQRNISVSPAADVFVCAKLFYFLCFFKTPFKNSFDLENYIKRFKVNEGSGQNLKLLWRTLEHNCNIIIPQQMKFFFRSAFAQNPEKRPTIDQILNSKMMEDKATPNQVKTQLSKRFDLITAGDQTIEKIKGVLNQLKQQREQLEIQRREIAQNIPESERTRSAATSSQTLSSFIAHYKPRQLTKQNLQIKQLNQSTISFLSQPYILVAFMDYYLTAEFNKKDFILFDLINQQQTISYRVTLGAEGKFCIRFQIKRNLENEKHQNQQNEQNEEEEEDEDEENLEIGNVSVAVFGQFFKREVDGGVWVQWTKGKEESFYGEFVFRALKNIYVMFLAVQPEIKKYQN